MKRFLRYNGLSLALFTLFLLSLVAQSIAGMHKHNEEQIQHGSTPVSYREFITSDDFLESTAENWESEFLALFAMVVLAIWLREKDSPESKEVNGRMTRPAAKRSLPSVCPE